MHEVNNPSITLLLLAGALVGIGVYLILERTLTRIIIGFAVAANGVNVLLLVAGGRAGTPPFSGAGHPTTQADPLVQALVLTAIVITLGTTAFMLAMAYRSWQLNGHDEVQDDVEDRRVQRKADLEQEPEAATESDLAEDAAQARDETETSADEADEGDALQQASSGVQSDSTSSAGPMAAPERGDDL